MARELIKEAVRAGARLWKACEVLEITVRTYQRWGKSSATGDARHGVRGTPANSLSTEERAALVEIATSERFRKLAPSQIVPILAEEGVYVASESSFYRVLRQEKLLAHRSRSRPAAHHRPMEYVAKGPNELWSWDITYLRGPVRGEFLYLYLVVDIWSRMIMAWEVAEEESGKIASQMIARACLEHGVEGNQLVIHSDNGGPMKGATLLATFQFLGIVPSFSRPRVSDDNPYSEALFRTLKYRPEYPGRAFEDLAAAREWVQRFVRWYNSDHRHSGIKFVSPAARHEGREAQILSTRKDTYEQARAAIRVGGRGERGTGLLSRKWFSIRIEAKKGSGRRTRSRESVLIRRDKKRAS
ncbi:MAG: IS3 family transposase [Spirochaetia bacterium]|jgi:transposase InsO family protein